MLIRPPGLFASVFVYSDFAPRVYMVILHIEHKVASYVGWKKAFDADPVDRKKAGVRSYRIYRPLEDRDFVIIDLEFDTLAQAEATLATLRLMWQQIEGKIVSGPRARILDLAESKSF